MTTDELKAAGYDEGAKVRSVDSDWTYTITSMSEHSAALDGCGVYLWELGTKFVLVEGDDVHNQR